MEYYELEISITFNRGELSVSYEYIWHRILKKEPRFAGLLFSGENLRKAIAIIAEDIKKDFAAVLTGDNAFWDLIKAESEKDSKEHALLLSEALLNIPKLVQPTFKEALARLNNTGLQGLRKKFAPKNNLLYINASGYIESMYIFKKPPTEYQKCAAFLENPGTLCISVSEGMYTMEEELAKRVSDDALILQKLKNTKPLLRSYKTENTISNYPMQT